MDRLMDAYIATYEHSDKSLENRDKHPATVTFGETMLKPKDTTSVDSMEEGMKAMFKKCQETYRALLKQHSPKKTDKTAPISQASATREKRHKECLEAKDYEGCMRFKSDNNQRRGTNDECVDNICIVKSNEVDIYGLPKPMGWRYMLMDDGRIFYFSKLYRVLHKGQQSRYIAIKRITRYYQSPKSGSSGTLIGGSATSTSCIGNNGGINYTTTGSSPAYIPGRSATPGGISSTAFTTVYDCKDNTYALYKNGKFFGGGWDKNPQGFFGKHLNAACRKGEPYRQIAPVLNIKM